MIEWNTLFTNWRKGAKDRRAARTPPTSPSRRWIRSSRWCASRQTKTFPPVSNNWGYFGNAEFDELIAKARTTFDDKERDAALARLHARIVEEAPFLWVAHDVGPRAMSAAGQGRRAAEELVHRSRADDACS